MSERTFALVKPNAVERGLTGAILQAVEDAGLHILAMKRLHLDRRQAEGFYHVHRERPFFGSLVAFMTSGPVVAMVLEGDDAIRRWRDLMGATDPAEAAEGTLRRRFGENIERNATHGSDAPETADFEIGYFFSGLELGG